MKVVTRAVVRFLPLPAALLVALGAGVRPAAGVTDHAGATTPAAADGLASARAFARRLLANGRAAATIERRALDPVTGLARSARGRLTLELPDRALLEFPATGERIALRSDGGEWLQPALQQMLRLGPRSAAAGLRWWELLLPGDGSRFVERALSARRYAVVSPSTEDFAADTAWVSLDAQGLPAELEYRDSSDSRVSYRFSGWRFQRPRGRSSFLLVPPEGVRVVELP